MAEICILVGDSFCFSVFETVIWGGLFCYFLAFPALSACLKCVPMSVIIMAWISRSSAYLSFSFLTEIRECGIDCLIETLGSVAFSDFSVARICSESAWVICCLLTILRYSLVSSFAHTLWRCWLLRVSFWYISRSFVMLSSLRQVSSSLSIAGFSCVLSLALVVVWALSMLLA